MRSERFVDCLAADATRLREVAARDLSAAVPSCPGWTVTDLVRHVAEVYLHKTECMRRNDFPRPWPPDLDGEEPLALLDRAYAALTGEFAARRPESPARTWYPPEQTVGFWIRRMAQETVIHRIDAELATGAPSAPIPADLAEDGVAEVLVRFLGHGSRAWPDDLGDLLDTLADKEGQTVRIVAGPGAWSARLTKEGVTVSSAADRAASVSRAGAGGDGGEAAASVSGEPEPVLRWLWGRAGDEAVRMDGDPALIGKLRELLAAVTV